MTTYTFGTTVDAAQYFEQDDGSSNPPPRPAADGVLKVRGLDLSALADQAYSGRTGYFAFTLQDVPVCQVSANNGGTWTTIISLEAQLAGANAGVAAANAVQVATQANATANAALAAANSGGVTFVGSGNSVGSPDVGPAKVFTLALIHARDDRIDIDPGDITGLQPVATSGLSADLIDAGNPGGVPLLDDSGFLPASVIPGGTGGGSGSGFLFIFQNTDGSWPARTTVTSDVTARVIYIPAYNPNLKPAIGTDAATAKVMNASLSRPGDVLENRRAAS